MKATFRNALPQNSWPTKWRSYLRRNIEFYETKFIKSKDVNIFCINKDIVADNIEDLLNIEFYQELILEDITHDIENNENNISINNEDENTNNDINKNDDNSDTKN